MSWHTFTIFSVLSFLASVALLSSFKVIVLALAALPSTIWELEFVRLVNLRLSSQFENLWRWLESGESWGEGLMEWLNTSSRSGHLSKFIDFSHRWLLKGLLNLLKWWEVKGLGNSLWEEFLGGLVLLLKDALPLSWFDEMLDGIS